MKRIINWQLHLMLWILLYKVCTIRYSARLSCRLWGCKNQVLPACYRCMKPVPGLWSWDPFRTLPKNKLKRAELVVESGRVDMSLSLLAAMIITAKNKQTKKGITNTVKEKWRQSGFGWARHHMLEYDCGGVTAEGSRAEGGDKRPPSAPLRLCKPPDLE